MHIDDDGEIHFDPMFSVPHIGTVADRDDPEKLGRVRLLIPGIYQVPSPWAFPLGTLGGGSPQRGGFFVPEKGADVMVFFVLADCERPMYLAGHWGKPGGTSEVPAALAGLSVQDTPNVRVIESASATIVLDDRPGNEQIIIKSKADATGCIRIAGGKIYVGDATANDPFVLGTEWKAGMEALFDALAALTVSTAVGPSSPPINSAAFLALKAALSVKLSTIIFGK